MSLIITNERPLQLIVTQEVSKIVEVVSAGPQGIPGPPGPASGTGDVQYTTTTSISGHRMVTIQSPGSISYADCTILSHAFKVAGITVNAASPGGSVVVKSSGEITEPSWNWDVNLPVYLGSNGLLTQIEPVVRSFLMIVGFPVSSSTLYLNISQPLF